LLAYFDSNKELVLQVDCKMVNWIWIWI
jgi:hypothetical protein